MSILFAVLLFSFLIFIHEFGHFIAAKLSGVQVNEFSMFMGPAIFKKQKGETLYTLRCIPIGGYCAMEGEDQDSENPRAFGNASWWKRLIILIAGSTMNFIAGLLILLVVFMPAKQFATPVIDTIEVGSSVGVEGGLQVGDRFLEVDGEKIYTRSDISLILGLNEGNVHDILVERNGETVFLDNFNMEKREFSNEDGTTSLRHGISFAVEKATFSGKLKYTWNTAIGTVRTVRLSLQMLLTGRAGLKDVTGPIGITQQISNVAQTSKNAQAAVTNMLYIGGFIAINLAVMNMLPFPALDGGRVVSLLLTIIVEKIIGKKLDPKYEGYLHGFGMILLLALMAVIMFKDIIFIFKR